MEGCKTRSMIADPHPQQQRRLAALYNLDILDTEREAEFDDIARLAAEICQTPIGVVNLIDADRQWFKAEVGLGVRSTPLDTSLCSHAILEGDFVEIPDTLGDVRMQDNPLCTQDGGLRFYAGAVLTSEDGLPVGTLCVLDHQPRTLSESQRRALAVLGRQVTRLFDLRLAVKRQALMAREIDHRVKNSLAAIGAIVSMQASRSKEPQVKAALAGVQSRLAAITALHEELHTTNHRSAIHLEDFLERLARHLRPLLPEGVSLNVVAQPAEVRSDTASTIGMIANEFVANCAKHAQGLTAVVIGGQSDGETYRLRCADDGHTDVAALAAVQASHGLGARIIGASAQSLGGQARWRLGEPGMVLDVQFPLAG